MFDNDFGQEYIYIEDRNEKVYFDFANMTFCMLMNLKISLL